MHNTNMRKWNIGLSVLGVLAAGLFVFVLIQGLQSKQDRVTSKAATGIAEKLNKYVDDKQEVPSSLAAAGITDVLSTISYHKKSDDTYQFCMTFKQSNIDVSSNVAQDLYGATTDRGLSSNGGSSYSDSYYSNNASSLYIDSTHKAGKQCQTIQTYVYTSDPYSSVRSDELNSSLYSQ